MVRSRSDDFVCLVLLWSFGLEIASGQGFIRGREHYGTLAKDDGSRDKDLRKSLFALCLARSPFYPFA